MAKIVKKGRRLEQEYHAIEQGRTDGGKRAKRAFITAAAVLAVLYAAALAAGIIAGAGSTVFVLMTVCFAAGVSVAAAVCVALAGFSNVRSANILASGINGEKIAAEVLSVLPDGYTVFQDVTVPYDGRTSEIDNIVVGRGGVFIVETKNHNGSISGSIYGTHWMQHKVGRGGTPYSNEIYSPVRQVGTHIYRLANYLRHNGVNTYVEGIVYFTNPQCRVKITGRGDVPVYTARGRDESRLRSRITSGEHTLDRESVRRVCELIGRL